MARGQPRRRIDRGKSFQIENRQPSSSDDAAESENLARSLQQTPRTCMPNRTAKNVGKRPTGRGVWYPRDGNRRGEGTRYQVDPLAVERPSPFVRFLPPCGIQGRGRTSIANGKFTHDDFQ